MSNIKHKVSTVSIFCTEDYSIFKMIEGNRGLNLHKIEKIIKEIQSGNDMLRYYPIQVKVIDNLLEILDGQHRYFICQKLKRPVHYILVTEERTMSDIAKVNSNVEKWTSQNFINCYVIAGNENYKLIQQYHSSYQFSVGVTLSLLTTAAPGKANGAVGSILKSSFEDGKFEVKTWDEAVAFGEMAKQFNSFSNWRSREFLMALYRIQTEAKVEMDIIYAAFQKNPQMLVEQANYKDYLLLLEKIVNVNKSKRIIIA